MLNFVKANYFTLNSLPIVYLIKKGYSVEDYGKFCGQVYAKGWKVPKEKGWTLTQVARAICLNYAMYPGAKLTIVEKEDKTVSAKIEGIKYADWLKSFEASKTEFEKFFTAVTTPIMDYLEIKHTITVEGENITISLSK